MFIINAMHLQEGIVVVVDVGPLTRLGLAIENTLFQQSKTCLINILQRKVRLVNTFRLDYK